MQDSESDAVRMNSLFTSPTHSPRGAASTQSPQHLQATWLVLRHPDLTQPHSIPGLSGLKRLGSGLSVVPQQLSTLGHQLPCTSDLRDKSLLISTSDASQPEDGKEPGSVNQLSSERRPQQVKAENHEDGLSTEEPVFAGKRAQTWRSAVNYARYPSAESHLSDTDWQHCAKQKVLCQTPNQRRLENMGRHNC
jgi:hypothetical protein